MTSCSTSRNLVNNYSYNLSRHLYKHAKTKTPFIYFILMGMDGLSACTSMPHMCACCLWRAADRLALELGMVLSYLVVLRTEPTCQATFYH